MTQAVRVRVRRVFDDPAPDDGARVLVDRLWPRGVSKERAAVDVWVKAVAPSDGLRRRFHGGEVGFEGFADGYRAELAANPGAVGELRAVLDAHPAVTLLTATRTPERSHVTVLLDVLGVVAGG